MSVGAYSPWGPVGLVFLLPIGFLTWFRPRTSLAWFVFFSPFVDAAQRLGFDPRLYWAFLLGLRALLDNFSSGKVVLPRLAVRAWTFFVALAAVGLWYARSELAGEDFEGAASTFRYFLMGSLVVYAVRQYLVTIRAVQEISSFFASSVGAIAGYGLWEASQQYREGGSGRIVSLFGNPNYFSSYLAIGVTLLLLFRRHETGSRRKLFTVAILLACLCCVATFSRSGNLALLTGLSFYWLLTVRQRSIRSAFPLVLLPMGIFSALILLGPVMPLRYRITYSDNPGSEDIARVGQTLEDLSRLEAAQYGLQLFEAHPWLGTGFGTFVARNYNATGNYVATHNTLLQVLTGTGLVGTILLLLVVWALACELSTQARRLVLPTVMATAVVGAFTDLLQSLEFLTALAIAFVVCTKLEGASHPVGSVKISQSLYNPISAGTHETA